ncbi:MAG: TVP38/TMEM64 family protein [Acidaminococcaceae bacterium]|nr:TVP38/TMEM64 family protein [Acidaminococcaceae bacterium]
MNNKLITILRFHRHVLVLLIYLGIIVALYHLPGVFHPQSVEDVRRWVTGYGVWGPVVYILLYVVRPLLLFPSLLLNVAAGILFPPLLGIPCLAAGGLGSAVLLFYMARTGIGSEFLSLHGGKWGSRIHQYLSDGTKNFQRMLWLRTVPLFPYDVISLVAGCTKMRLITFVVTTLLGILPGAVAYNVLGDALGGNSGYLFSVALLVIAFGIPLAFWYFGGERNNLSSKEKT